MSGRPCPTARRPTTGCPSLAVRHGSGYAPPAIPLQLPFRAARPQLQSEVGTRFSTSPLLAGAWGRRLPARHDQLLFPLAGTEDNPALRANATTRRRRSIVQPGPSLHKSRPKTSPSSSASALLDGIRRRLRRRGRRLQRGLEPSRPTPPAVTRCTCATLDFWRGKTPPEM